MGSHLKTFKNAAKNKLQASRGTVAQQKIRRPQARTAKKGFKRAPRDLDEWIRLANLVPPGQTLPAFEEVLPRGEIHWSAVIERIAKLNDPLRSELLAVASGDLPEKLRKWLTLFDEALPDYTRVLSVFVHYTKILTAVKYLRILARSPAEAAMDIFESFVSTLRYAELTYLRECGHCGAIFYAARKSQFGCTPAHSSAIRKKRKRERDKANREYKKKKRAIATRKR